MLSSSSLEVIQKGMYWDIIINPNTLNFLCVQIKIYHT